jgi:hypothetical protein
MALARLLFWVFVASLVFYDFAFLGFVPMVFLTDWALLRKA